MKISFFETSPAEKRFFEKRLTGHDLRFFKEPLGDANAEKARGCDAVSIFIYSKIDGRILDALPDIKLVDTRSTGYEHIDLEECRKRKILVCNVPSYGENTVAEHTFALILSVSRNLHKAFMRTTRGDYSIEGLQGFDLKCKTLGIVGAGKIGLHVIKIAKGFGMNVLVYDTKYDCFLSEILGFEYAAFEEVLKKSDIISLHVPYNEKTHHLINKGNISLIKRGAVLVNTSRGAVVETEALIEALDKGILTGAGLDVLEGEDLIKEEKQILHDPKKMELLGTLAKDHILLGRDDVVFTPHIAFYSKEALERILEETVKNITAYASGKPQNLV